MRRTVVVGSLLLVDGIERASRARSAEYMPPLLKLDGFSGPHHFATLDVDPREVVYGGNYRLWDAAIAGPGGVW
jgi:hypothetical protein